jgi:PIN domain nuclease of toxin-antitoxin system
LRLLLDTHTLLWTLLDDPRLSEKAQAAVADPANEIIVSAVSLYEITQKHRNGKLPQSAPFVRDYARMMAGLDWTPLPVTIDHAALAGGMDIDHRDPFDRMLIAQARIERIPLVTNEELFDRFGVERVW